MNKLQEWGFRKSWWRNQRGEYWVIGQTILSGVFVLLPVEPMGDIPMAIRWGMAIACGLMGLMLAIGGLLHLGDNLTPLPHPKDESKLVTSGVYRFVRHPIYSSVIFCALAFALWQMSVFHAIGALVFLLFFDRKAAQEEIWLMERFPEYRDYRLLVHKLLPGIY